MSHFIQCPGCKVNHPVAALPPAGTALRCNNCGCAFVTRAPRPVTQQPIAQQPLGYPQPLSNPDPFQQYDPFRQQPAVHPSQPWKPVEPKRPQAPLEPWKVAVVGGIAGVALLVVGITVGVAVNSNRSAPETPPVAAAPAAPLPAMPVYTPTPSTPTPSTAAPAPNYSSSTYSSSMPVASSSASTPSRSSPPLPTVVPRSAGPNQSAVSPVGDSSARQRIAQLKPIETKPQFVYNWRPGEKYRYGFEMRNEGGEDGPGGRLGTIEYEVSPLPGGAEGKGQHASGTAFVIHSQGLLLTCNHVVAAASSLKVHLNNKIHTADVVAVDKPNDLAVIRIPASGLFSLPLGDSDQVQLAEDVKAFGYPLSDVLGQSIKVTSGTIAGRIQDPAGQRLQVDITINPGNSGGPLVNRFGQAIGINSAGLFGSSIQEVSFAVPSNLAKNLLHTIGVESDGQVQTTAQEGTKLAAQTQQATAFVEVELGSESAALLQFTGSSKSTGSLLQPSQQITSRVAVGLDGEVLGAQDDLPLGFGLNTFGTMVFERLPGDGETEWEEKEVTPLSIGGSSDQRRQVIGMLLENRVNYKLKSADGSQVVIDKKIACSTVGQSNMGTVRITGEGAWTFDRRDGVPVKMEMDVDSYVSIAGKTTRFKGKVRYERLSSSNPSSWQTNLEKELASIDDLAASESNLPKIELPPLSLEDSTDQQVIALLRQLRAKNKEWQDLVEPLEKLARMKPIAKRRDEVANVLHGIRTEFPPGFQLPWILAVRVWGTSKNVPTLLYILDAPTSRSGERTMAIESLGRLPATKEGAAAVGRWLEDDQLGPLALQALVAMGRIAEEPAADLLKGRLEQRIIGCLILANVGAEKSVTALENYLRTESDPRCRAAAQEALQQVRRRVAVDSKKAN